MPLSHGKKRPLVDPTVFDLAREWITENYVVNAETADAASDSLDDGWTCRGRKKHEAEITLARLSDHGQIHAEGRGELVAGSLPAGVCGGDRDPGAAHAERSGVHLRAVSDPVVTTFYNFSGGMESAAMLVVDRERIQATGAIVNWADTGKQFPEMAESIAQIEAVLGLTIVTVPRRITFDEFLFERGGMLRKGMNDCSRRMKRSNLARFHKSHPKPWEINLGFNAAEDERATSFSAMNERPWCHWRYPLIEAEVSREASWDICRKASLSIVVGMYEKMGRFDCFWCPNQRPSQAMKVIELYPELAAEWIAAEDRKGHSFMSIPLRLLPTEMQRREDEKLPLFACSCFGGDDDVFEDDEPTQALAAVRG